MVVLFYTKNYNSDENKVSVDKNFKENIYVELI